MSDLAYNVPLKYMCRKTPQMKHLHVQDTQETADAAVFSEECRGALFIITLTLARLCETQNGLNTLWIKPKSEGCLFMVLKEIA